MKKLKKILGKKDKDGKKRETSTLPQCCHSAAEGLHGPGPRIPPSRLFELKPSPVGRDSTGSSGQPVSWEAPVPRSWPFAPLDSSTFRSSSSYVAPPPVARPSSPILPRPHSSYGLSIAKLSSTYNLPPVPPPQSSSGPSLVETPSTYNPPSPHQLPAPSSHDLSTLTTPSNFNPPLFPPPQSTPGSSTAKTTPTHYTPPLRRPKSSFSLSTVKPPSTHNPPPPLQPQPSVGSSTFKLPPSISSPPPAPAKPIPTANSGYVRTSSPQIPWVADQSRRATSGPLSRITPSSPPRSSNPDQPYRAASDSYLATKPNILPTTRPSSPVTGPGNLSGTSQRKPVGLKPTPKENTNPPRNPTQNAATASPKPADNSPEPDSDIDIEIEDILGIMLANASRTSGSSGPGPMGAMDALLIAALLSKTPGSVGDKKPSTEERKSPTKQRANPDRVSRPLPSKLPAGVAPGPSSITASSSKFSSQPRKSAWPPPTSSPKFKVPLLADQRTDISGSQKTVTQDDKSPIDSRQDLLTRLGAMQTARNSYQSRPSAVLTKPSASEPSNPPTTSSITRAVDRSAAATGKTAQPDEKEDFPTTSESIARAQRLDELGRARAAAIAGRRAARSATAVTQQSTTLSPTAAPTAVAQKITTLSPAAASTAAPTIVTQQRTTPSPTAAPLLTDVLETLFGNAPSRPDGIPASSQYLPKKKSMTFTPTGAAKQSMGPKFKVPVLSESERSGDKHIC